MKIGLFAGSFSPITNYHLDLIGRSLHIVDHIVVAIDENSSSPYLNREELVKSSIKSALGLSDKQCTVSSYSGMLGDFAYKIGATILVRGIRNIADYEREKDQVAINKQAYKGLETVFLLAKPELSMISSQMIQNLISLGGDISPYVQKSVLKAQKENK